VAPHILQSAWTARLWPARVEAARLQVREAGPCSGTQCHCQRHHRRHHSSSLPSSFSPLPPRRPCHFSRTSTTGSLLPSSRRRPPLLESSRGTHRCGYRTATTTRLVYALGTAPPLTPLSRADRHGLQHHWHTPAARACSIVWRCWGQGRSCRCCCGRRGSLPSSRLTRPHEHGSQPLARPAVPTRTRLLLQGGCWRGCGDGDH
jgi:hypothetical protein